MTGGGAAGNIQFPHGVISGGVVYLPQVSDVSKNHSRDGYSSLEVHIILCLTVAGLFYFTFQQALTSGGFPIAVPLQANSLNTGSQGGLTVNG